MTSQDATIKMERTMYILTKLANTVCLLAFLITIASTTDTAGQIIYNWNKVDFRWPNSSMKDEYLRSGKYIPENNIITGIKVYKDKVYVTVPRWRLGVPSTLNLVVMDTEGSAVLQPFPSWEMNKIGNCQSLQYVQSMEIDPNNGLMWIIDIGRVNTQGQPRNLCPAKLVVYDLNAQKVNMTYLFPNTVVSYISNFMNDIVLDYVDGRVGYVYITDTSDAKIIVYNCIKNMSYYFQHQSMNSEPMNGKITIGSDVLLSKTPIDGIAISPDFRFLYYCPLAGVGLYRVPTTVLRENADFRSAVQKVGDKISQTDGMVFGQKYLYYGAFSQNAVFKWNKDEVNMTPLNQIQLVDNSSTMQWVDTFSFDEHGNLWFVANTLQRFFLRTMNDSNVKYVNIWKVSTSDKSYLWMAKKTTIQGINFGNSNHLKDGHTFYKVFLFLFVISWLQH